MMEDGSLPVAVTAANKGPILSQGCQDCAAEIVKACHYAAWIVACWQASGAVIAATYKQETILALTKRFAPYHTHRFNLRLAID